MSDTVLVGYATRYGSTREVAEVVAQTLQEAGVPVEFQPVKKLNPGAGCRAAVVGAPLFIGAWHKDAVHFLEQQHEALSGKPVAIFVLGPLSTDAKEMEGVRAQFDKVLTKFSWLKPVDVQIFTGKYDPKVLRFPDNLLAALPASPLHQLPASDMRDWDAIRAWAKRLAAIL
jgi:menaquinone-dependent protoporphyrinogen oxidase